VAFRECLVWAKNVDRRRAELTSAKRVSRSAANARNAAGRGRGPNCKCLKFTITSGFRVGWACQCANLVTYVPTRSRSVPQTWT